MQAVQDILEFNEKVKDNEAKFKVRTMDLESIAIIKDKQEV